MLDILLALSLLLVSALLWGWLFSSGPLSHWAGFGLPLALLLDAALCLLARQQSLAASRRSQASDPQQASAEDYAAHHLWIRALLDGGSCLFFLWQIARFVLS